MASFNTRIYDASSVAYNILDQTYIDGSNCIPINGTTWYPNKFGNVMCSFCVDGGDSILGGNVIITGDISACSNVLVNNQLTVVGSSAVPTLTSADSSTSSCSTIRTSTSGTGTPTDPCL